MQMLRGVLSQALQSNSGNGLDKFCSATLNDSQNWQEILEINGLNISGFLNFLRVKESPLCLFNQARAYLAKQKKPRDMSLVYPLTLGVSVYPSTFCCKFKTTPLIVYDVCRHSRQNSLSFKQAIEEYSRMHSIEEAGFDPLFVYFLEYLIKDRAPHLLSKT